MLNSPTTAFLPERAWLAIVRSLGLSEREAQVAHLILNEDTTEGAIAASLAISPHTVHTHLERLYRKLRVTSRCQVVTRMFQQYVELAAEAEAARSLLAPSPLCPHKTAPGEWQEPTSG